MLSCIWWYEAGEVVISFKSVKPCCGFTSLLPLEVRLGLVTGIFLNPRLPVEIFLGTTLIGGILDFEFEPLAVPWRIRCFVLKALPCATFGGLMSITFTLGCGFKEVLVGVPCGCGADGSSENKELGDAGGSSKIPSTSSAYWCLSVQVSLRVIRTYRWWSCLWDLLRGLSILQIWLCFFLVR